MHELLSQTDTWVNKQGEEIAVSEIDSAYAANIIGFLERRAALLHDQECRAALSVVPPTADMASYHYEQEIDALFQADPREWLQDQPLFHALQERVDG